MLILTRRVGESLIIGGRIKVIVTAAHGSQVKIRVDAPVQPEEVYKRLVGESLFIGDSIKVTVLAANGNQVKLGVDAPDDVPVHREEVYKRIQNSKDGQD